MATEEAAAGFHLFTEILNRGGLKLRNSSRPWQNYPAATDPTATYVEFGVDDRSTNIVLCDKFLIGLPNTRELISEAESYVAAIAGRIKCGPVDAFYCRSGIPVSLEIHWPMKTSVTSGGQFVSWLMVTATNDLSETVAICSLQFKPIEYPTPSPFRRIEQITKRVRDAVDEGTVNFVPPETHSSYGQIIEQRPTAERRPASEEQIERFLTGKSYDMGFRAAYGPRPFWVPDPWDASYLGTTTRALSQAAHKLRARKLIILDDTSQYATPSDKLISEGPGESSGSSHQRQKLSLSTIPEKEEFDSHVDDRIQNHTEFALVYIDLDKFKSVNDTQGHPAGNACLESVIRAIATAIGSKGTIYRWGGDEFAICLPDFSTPEAGATAERVRRSIEDAKPGGSIAVTASIGVCATDQLKAQSAAEIVKAADDAMYASKNDGGNRVTVWPIANASAAPADHK